MALTDLLSPTDFSRSFSLSILDDNGAYLHIKTSSNNSIEFLISRDPSLVIPQLFHRYVTGKKVFFNNHQMNLTRPNPNLTYSIHFELHPSYSNLSYLLLHRFDQQDASPILFCPSSKNGQYVHFLDNNQTADHQFITYALRELTSTEKTDFCSHPDLSRSLLPLTTHSVIFSSNYSIRVYQSGCFYLNSNNSWQSDGLLVSIENCFHVNV
jgi:hypothetical protein